MDILNQQIPLWVALVYLVYTAAVQALPRPDATSGKGYVFLYSFLHLLGMNLALAFDPKKASPAPRPGETTEAVQPNLLWKYPPPPKG